MRNCSKKLRRESSSFSQPSLERRASVMAMSWSTLQTSSPSMASCSSLLLNDTLPPTADPMMYTSQVRRPSWILMSSFELLRLLSISW